MLIKCFLLVMDLIGCRLESENACRRVGCRTDRTTFPTAIENRHHAENVTPVPPAARNLRDDTGAGKQSPNGRFVPLSLITVTVIVPFEVIGLRRRYGA